MGIETGDGGQVGPLPYCGQFEHRMQRVGQAYTETVYQTDRSGSKRYRFNSLGYRGAEYDPGAAYQVFVFGESNAFGSGLDLEEAWPSRFVELHVAESGLDPGTVGFLCFADGGASNMAIAREVIRQCSAVRPDLVLVNFSELRRSETFVDGLPFQVHPQHVQPWNRRRLLEQGARAKILLEMSDRFYSFASWERCVSESLQAILLVQHFCAARDITAVASFNSIRELDGDRVRSDPYLDPLRKAIDPGFLAPFDLKRTKPVGELAADGIHAGRTVHRHFAADMYRFFRAGGADAAPAPAAAPPETAEGVDGPAAVRSRVAAFYRELPFNFHDTVEGAVRAVRDNPIARTYPDLHALLRRGVVRTAVEFGCGAGWLSNAMALHYGVAVRGIDMTNRAVQRAREVAKVLGVADRVHFDCENLFDAADLDPVDLVLSMGVLHHTHDAHGGFLRIREVVGPEGHIFVGLYHEPGRRVFLDLAHEALRDRGTEAAYAEYRHLQGVRELDETHARSWFRDQVLHPHETLHTLREVWGWLEESGLEPCSTSINRFERLGDPEELFALEQTYAERARVAILEERRYFPGFFTVLARDRRQARSVAAQ